MDRGTLFRTLGVVKSDVQIDALTHQAYVNYEMAVWKNNLESAPHGHPWHTSFHGSQFPGGDKSCGRKSIYSLMDIPNAEPSSPMLRATGEMGKAAENQILFRWRLAGLLIAGEGPVKDGLAGEQLKISDRNTWLSGAIDAVLGLPDYPYVLPVDIKSKSKEVIDNMKTGSQGYYPEHYAQVQAYIYLCRGVYEEMEWEKLGYQPPIGAVIYYVSRENPRHTHEFFVDIDEDFIQNGVNNLLQWKKNFLADILPERDKSWKWTEQPCGYCPFKKFACKPDVKAGTTNISSSVAIDFAQKLRQYDLDKVKKGITDRWTI